ncbi:MAG: tetratricopeptide repeat protein, partial [Myxococcota bacterium]|nr:tetratricopeptide repeat protein [Myxococcota bacterium]
MSVASAGRASAVVGGRVAAVVAASLVLALATGSARADTLEDVFRAGNDAYFSGEYAAATERYEHLVDLGVRDADVFYNLGMAYARQGRHGRAIAAFERSLRVRSGDAEASRALERSR